MEQFDYETKIWGGTEVRISPSYLGALRLKFALEDLEGVGGRILDAGCGGGGFAKAIRHYRSDLEVHGVDISKPAVDFASRNPKGVSFRIGDLYKLPYKDEYFDAVVAEDVLEHLGDPQKALEEALRVLKPNGVFHLFVPLEGEWFTLHFWLEKLGWRAKERLAGHIQKLKLPTLEEMLANCGFRVAKKRYSGHFLGQFMDVFYYSFLALSGEKLDTGLEQYLGSGGSRRALLKLVKNVATTITNLESLVLSSLPASGVHILCRKER